MFKHEPIELGYDLVAETTPNGRMYKTPDGKSYPSITTMLGYFSKAAIMAWRKRVGAEEANRISRRAAGQGTRIHHIAEDYINNKPDYLKEDEMPHILSMWKPLKKVLDEHLGTIVLQECPLYSHYLKLAGRVDLVAEFDGKLSIVDFKTSRRVKTRDEISSYFMQAAAYSIMFEERTGTPITQLVIAMTVENESEPLLFVEKRDDWAPFLLDKRDKFYKSLT
jgi:genome maintenance exonuclease 1